MDRPIAPRFAALLASAFVSFAIVALLAGYAHPEVEPQLAAASTTTVVR